MSTSQNIMKSSISAISITIFVTILMAPLTASFVLEGSDLAKIKFGSVEGNPILDPISVDPMVKFFLQSHSYEKMKSVCNQLPKIEKLLNFSLLGDVPKPQGGLLTGLLGSNTTSNTTATVDSIVEDVLPSIIYFPKETLKSVCNQLPKIEKLLLGQPLLEVVSKPRGELLTGLLGPPVGQYATLEDVRANLEAYTRGGGIQLGGGCGPGIQVGGFGGPGVIGPRLFNDTFNLLFKR